jgi:hypothetical protein
MAINTTLAAACGINDQTIQPTSTTGNAVGWVWLVDGEYMTQLAVATSGGLIPVQRGGKQGSVQSSHPILAGVTAGLPSEFPGPQPGWANNQAIYKPQIVSYGASGAIVPPTYDTLVMLDKATAAAMTLTSPTGATPDGVEVTILSTTAAAHTITYTPGFHGDTESSDVATFAATTGNSITLLSMRGVWGVKCKEGVTLA